MGKSKTETTQHGEIIPKELIFISSTNLCSQELNAKGPMKLKLPTILKIILKTRDKADTFQQMGKQIAKNPVVHRALY